MTLQNAGHRYRTKEPLVPAAALKRQPLPEVVSEHWDNFGTVRL
jgi:hypothetical protein